VELSDVEVKSLVRDVKKKMITGEVDADIAICVKNTGSDLIIEGREANSLSMGDKFTDDAGNEIEVLRVINHTLTVTLNNKVIERSNELRSSLDKRFYISFGDEGQVKHGLVKLESTGVMVLPRYQEKLGRDFIKHAELLELNPRINGSSIAAGMVKEMINIHKHEPDKKVSELYQLAAQQMANSKKAEIASPDNERDIERPSFKG